MNWRGIWHLGTRYLRRTLIKTALLVAAFTLVWLLPTVVALVVSQAESHLRSRAAETPLIIGRTGSPLELAFNGLYFTKPDLTPFPLKEASTGVEGVPIIAIYAKFSSLDYRIVGTTIDYFRFRNLTLSEGRVFGRMGECVIGSKIAERQNLKLGEAVISSPGSMFDLAGVYPLKMKICGVIATTGTPDDNAVFVDLKTTWIIEGLGHGHVDAKKMGEGEILAGSSTEILTDSSTDIKLNASVLHYNEVTAENSKDFHFHGDQSDFPITAAIAIPSDAKAQALIKGRFQSRTDMQIISPVKEMDELFDTVFRIQKVVSGILFLIGLATIAIGFLVFSLSYRLRVREFNHLSNMGAAPMFMRWLIAFEAIFVLVTSLILAGLILLIIQAVTPLIIRGFLG